MRTPKTVTLRVYTVTFAMPDTPHPLVTVVIPTYQRPILLQRAIASAVEQHGIDVRVCVFDNCSNDDTEGVVRRMMRSYHQIRYQCHSRNLGAAANFDFALRSVDTPFFSVLSDDDYLLPGFYQHALDGLAEYPAAMFWAGVTLNVDEQGVVWDDRVQRWPREGIFEAPEGVMAMTGGMAPTWTGTVFRREVLQQAGFPEFEMLGPADLDYCLRLASRFPYLVEKHPSAVFTLNSASFSATQPLSSFWPGWIKMLRNVAKMDSLTTQDRERVLEALHADARRMLFRRGAHALCAGRRDYARDAAQALAMHYGQNARARILRVLAFGGERVPGVQIMLSRLYKLMEARIVHSREGLQGRYGHLLRYI